MQIPSDASEFLETMDRENRHLQEAMGVVFLLGEGNTAEQSQSASSMALALWLLAVAPLLAEANDCTCVLEKFCTSGPPPPSDSCAPGEVCCVSGDAGDGLESRWGGYNGWSWPSQGRGVAQPPGNSWGGKNRAQTPPPAPARRPQARRPGPATRRPFPPAGSARPMAQQDLLTSHTNSRLLPLSTCGSSSKPNIINGKATGVGSYTWLVLLTYVFPSGEKRNMCAGALINSRYVLTAAHCFKNLDRSGIKIQIFCGQKLVEVTCPAGCASGSACDGQFKVVDIEAEIITVKTKSLCGESVVVGEYDVRQDPDCEEKTCSFKQDVKVEKIIQHPQYQSAGDINDIALVRLAEEVKFTKFVSPICLPFTDGAQNDEDSFVAGWGKTEEGPDSPLKLFVQIPVVNDTYCRDFYMKNYSRAINTQVHFCAGGRSDKKDSCNGDSGGPLMTIQWYPAGRSNRFVALGVVSFGPRTCGTIGAPGVYTRISNYVQWVLDQLQP